MTPAKVRAVYNVSNAQGSILSTQAAFGGASQYFGPSDLVYFQSEFSQTPQVIASSIGDHSSDAQCSINAFNCAEANLDIQYMMSTSPVSPTTYWYTDSLFATWLVAVAALTSPPLVLSISYGLDEKYASTSELNAFNTQAIKLGVMGVTIVVASGDDGANSNSLCGYAISYPASSPYVTAVGATSVTSATLLFSII
jgi:tripeptidyl-peptidase-1